MNRKNSKIAAVFLICAIIFASMFSTIASATTEAKDLSSQSTLYEIDVFVTKNIKKGRIPGLQLNIVKGDETVFQKGYGYADVSEKKEVDSKTLFELGSNSKAFTALGVMELLEKGLISFDDEITAYLPWLTLTYKGAPASVTIEQLLHHTSGIPFKSIDKIPARNDDQALEETIKTLIDTELENEPGSTFEYATINYDVLGLVIEKISGMTFENYMETNVLTPLGLENTHMNSDGTEMSKGYKISYLGQKEYTAPVYRGNKPAGYIISNGDDMAKWMKIQMGALDSGAFNKKYILNTHIPNNSINPLPNGTNYAAGWFVSQKTPTVLSHPGNNPNYSSFITLMPDSKIGISILMNTNSDYAQYIGENIRNIIMKEEIAPPIKDLYMSAGTVSLMLTAVFSIILIATVIFFIRGVRDIKDKKRAWKAKAVSPVILLLSILFMVGLAVCVYLVPYILYRGVTWSFINVWLPSSFAVTIPIGIVAILLIYIYILFNSFFEKKNSPPYFILCILSFISGFGNALIIFTINMTINVDNNTRIKILVYFVLGIALYICGQKTMRSQLIHVTNGIVYSKRMNIVGKLLNSNFSKFENIDSGIINATLNNDTEKVSEFANVLINGATSGITLICCFTYLGFINLPALLLSIGIILLIAAIYFVAGEKANKIAEEARDMQNIFFQFIKDLIGGIKELNLRHLKKMAFKDDMDESCKAYREKKSKAAISFANMIVIGELVFTLAIGIIVFTFPLFLKNLTGGVIASFVFILLYMVGPVHGILDMIPNAIEVRISLAKINKLIKDIDSSEDIPKTLNLKDKKIQLRLEDAEYAYDQNPESNFSMGPINCEFNSGEITFITGGNGSGKSTLARLVTGLYSPSAGKVTLNGEKISGNSLSECYTTVFSDFYLFKKLYGINCEKKQEEIDKHLKILKLDTKVEVEDSEFSTIKLSTGQKKRLALLVAYLEDKDIFLFDEWAADQDPEFRYFFYNTLLPELKNRNKCVIAITHDDNYFSLADNVIKMDMGKLV